VSIEFPERRLFNDEEQAAMDALNQYMDIVLHKWGIQSNEFEAVAALHVLQGHVAQHALAREYPGEFSDWWLRD
jgi:hypothetical protein